MSASVDGKEGSDHSQMVAPLGQENEKSRSPNSEHGHYKYQETRDKGDYPYYLECASGHQVWISRLMEIEILIDQLFLVLCFTDLPRFERLLFVSLFDFPHDF